MNASVAILVVSLLPHVIPAQNLVPNSSFEELISCPQSFSTVREQFRLPGWRSASKGTPDHFHSCSWDEAGVPNNWAGTSMAHSGNGYAGIYLWMGPNSQNNYREYIQCELMMPLLAETRYLITFYYKLASYSVFAVNRIGLLLTDEALFCSHDQVIDQTPNLSVMHDSAITRNTGSWEHASLEYRAKGGERYLTIGNFFTNQDTRYTRLPQRAGLSHMLKNSAYYYIDDVSVVLLEPLPASATSASTGFDSSRFELNKTYILTTIQFDFDRYTLMESSFQELNELAQYLRMRTNVQVEISGHTDYVGSDEYNRTLSDNRAKQVAAYLVSQGISADRILAKGLGKSVPINPGLTDEARAVNRRVEIRFSEKPLPGKF